MTVSTFLSTRTFAAPVGADAVQDDPKTEIRTGLAVIGAFAAVFAGWAALTPLDAAATAPGQITVSGHSQVIQHREGGVVAAVDVVEGQHVRAGQVLVELAPEEVGAEVRSLRAQMISLQAQRARLTAEIEGSPTILWPVTFNTLVGEDLDTAKAVMKSQQAQFDAGLGSLHAQQAVNARKAASINEQIAGSKGQLSANTKQQELVEQQLAGLRSLAARGYASQNSLRAMERAAADLAGAHDQHQANIADYHQQIAEAQLQSMSLAKQRSETAATALKDTEDQLNAVIPKLDAAKGQLARGTLRAQTDGVVTGLSVFASGSVVAPGQKIMEVVPSHPSLVVSARIAANDIEGVHVGQKGEVRFLSMSARRVPILSGSLTKVSADAFTDDKTGQSYYTAEVTVPQSELNIIRDVRGAESSVRPGVPVQVMIPLHKRTAMDYLFEPLSQSLWKSFRR